MQHISSHIQAAEPKKKDRATERGELMRYFMQKLNMTRARDLLPPLTMGRMARALEAIPTPDLYFLKSICDDASKRGDISSFSKKFWWEINPKNHTEKAKQEQEKAAKKMNTYKRKKASITTNSEVYEG